LIPCIEEIGHQFGNTAEFQVSDGYSNWYWRNFIENNSKKGKDKQRSLGCCAVANRWV
jgi:hypothetical protein